MRRWVDSSTTVYRWTGTGFEKPAFALLPAELEQPVARIAITAPANRYPHFFH